LYYAQGSVVSLFSFTLLLFSLLARSASFFSMPVTWAALGESYDKVIELSASMTFDEIQQTLEQMLAVQRELQESQLGQRQQQIAQGQQIQDMMAYQERQQRLIDRLIGYSITNESDHLTLEERLNALEQRIKRLEPRDS
jgi:hypothetical protein